MMTTGGVPTSCRYYYCSFWVDHFSQFVYITKNRTKHAEDLVKSKLEFEEFAAHFGAKIYNIQADNGVCTAKIFQESCMKN